MEDGVLRAILRDAKTIAIVGLSDKPERPSFSVGAYLVDCGYDVVPINPMIEKWAGRKSYPSLSALPPDMKIDIVDVFRKSEDAGAVAREAVALPHMPKIVWLQEGVRSEEAEKVVEDAGVASGKAVFFIQDRCIMKEHTRLQGI